MEEKCLNLINYANHHNQKHHHHHQMDDDQLQSSSEGADAAASTTDATTNEINDKIHHHINHIHHRHHNRIDSTGTGIFLETPIIEENTISMNSHDYENAKPKRLSDEFLSQSSDEDQLLLNHTTSSADVAVLESLKEEADHDEDDDENDVEERAEEDEEEVAEVDDEVEDDDEMTIDSDVQSMDAIERRDFEHEQRLTGGRILKLSSLTDGDNCLKLNILNKKSESNETSSATASESKSANSSDYGAAGTSGVNDRVISSDSKVGGLLLVCFKLIFIARNFF